MWQVKEISFALVLTLESVWTFFFFFLCFGFLLINFAEIVQIYFYVHLLADLKSVVQGQIHKVM